jgi:hypothetical protein
MMLQSEVRKVLSALSLACAAMFLLAACASGGTTGGETESCEIDVDCPLVNADGENLYCYEGECLTQDQIDARGGNNTSDTGVQDTGGNEDTGTSQDTGGTQDTGTTQDTGGTEDTGGTQDTGTSGCNPQCGPDEFCNSNNVCEEIPTGGDCTSQGDTCDANQVDQGNFWCVSTGSGGTCVLKCDTDFTASGCSAGEYCRNVGTEQQERLGCVPADCSSDADCSGGTCVNFDNQYGTCVPAGTLQAGETCTVGGSTGCVRGYFCRRLQSGSDAGVCSSLCQPWSSSTGCPSGQYCTLFTSREGICTDQVEQPPMAAYQAGCTEGNMCTDATRCFALSSDNFCLKYCRTGQSDCAGLSDPSTCDNYVFAGERSYGICFPTCSPGDCCPASDPTCGSQCVQGKCRSTCSAGNEVQDCCGGSTPCDFTCVNGLCE